MESFLSSCARSGPKAERKTPTCAGLGAVAERKSPTCDPISGLGLRTTWAFPFQTVAQAVTTPDFPFQDRMVVLTTPAFPFQDRAPSRTSRRFSFRHNQRLRTTPDFPFRRPGHPSQLGLFLSGALAGASDQAVCAYRHHDDGHHAKPHYITQSLTTDSGEIQGRSPMIGAIRVGCRPCTRRAI